MNPKEWFKKEKEKVQVFDLETFEKKIALDEKLLNYFKHVNRENLKIIIEELRWIKSLDQLKSFSSNYKAMKFLENANPEFVRYFIGDSKEIDSLEKLIKIFDIDSPIAIVMQWPFIVNIKYFFEDLKWIDSLKELADLCIKENTGPSIIFMLMKTNIDAITKIKDFFEIKSLRELIKICENLGLEDLYENDFFLEGVLTKIQIMKMLGVLRYKYDEFEVTPEVLKEATDTLMDKMLNRLERNESSVESLINYYRPKENPNTKSNAKKANKLQAKKLRAKKFKDLKPEDIESLEKKDGRDLVLYIRQGQTQISSTKTAMIVSAMHKYIEVEKRSPVFNKIVIVSVDEDEYPKEVHNMSVSKNAYIYKKGQSFINLGLGGNFVFFTHSNAKEQQDIDSTPIIGQGVIQNPDKYYSGENTFIPLQIFFGLESKNSPQLGKDFESKNRTFDIEKMLRAMMWSVLCLENQMLREIKAEDDVV